MIGFWLVNNWLLGIGFNNSDQLMVCPEGVGKYWNDLLRMCQGEKAGKKVWLI